MRRHGLLLFVAIAVLIGGCQRGPASESVVSPSVPIPAVASLERPWIELSPEAEEKIKTIRRESGIGPEIYLMFGVEWPEGICSPQHQMRFEDKLVDGKMFVFETAGMKAAVPWTQKEMFRDARVNFGSKHGEQGFIFDTPNLEGESLKKWEPVLQADWQKGRPAETR